MQVRILLAAPMPITIQQEALESLLESLLSYQAERPEGHVCVICYGNETDGTCDCLEASWWPVADVIKRIEGRMRELPISY